MGREDRIKDSARAVDAKDIIKRARREALVKLMFQAIGVLVLIVIVFYTLKGLNWLLDYASEENVQSVPIDSTVPE